MEENPTNGRLIAKPAGAAAGTLRDRRLETGERAMTKPAGRRPGCRVRQSPRSSPPCNSGWTGCPTRSATNVFLLHLSAHHPGGGDAIENGFFEDPAWVERWDVAFAELYLTALDNELASGAESPDPGDWRSPLQPTCPHCATSSSASTPM